MVRNTPRMMDTISYERPWQQKLQYTNIGTRDIGTLYQKRAFSHTLTGIDKHQNTHIGDAPNEESASGYEDLS